MLRHQRVRRRQRRLRRQLALHQHGRIVLLRTLRQGIRRKPGTIRSITCGLVIYNHVRSDEFAL